MPILSHQRQRVVAGPASSGIPRILVLQQDVVERRAEVEQQVVLEHDADVGQRLFRAACRRRGSRLRSGGDQPGGDQHQRALAAARRSDQRHELAALDRERHVLDRGEDLLLAGKALGDAATLDRGAAGRHGSGLRGHRFHVSTSADWPATVGRVVVGDRLGRRQLEVLGEQRIRRLPVLLGHAAERRRAGRAEELQVDLELLLDLLLGRGRELLDHRFRRRRRIPARHVPAFEARRDELPVQVRIGGDLLVARDDRQADRRHADVAVEDVVDLEAAVAQLHRLEVGAAQDRVDLLLEQRADERRRIDVDDVELRRVDVVGGEDRVQQRRLRGARLHGDALADQVGGLPDARVFERDDREAVGLQDRRDDLHRRVLRAELHRRRRVGETDVGLAGGDELRGGARAAALLDRQVDAGLLVEAELLRVHEAGLRTAGKEVERQLHRLGRLRLRDRRRKRHRERRERGGEHRASLHGGSSLGRDGSFGGRSHLRCHGMSQRSAYWTM